VRAEPIGATLNFVKRGNSLMGAELARPFALTLCMVSLYSVFHAAFLVPASSFEERLWNALELLAVTLGICVTSGYLFRHTAPGRPSESDPANEPNSVPLGATLPVRLFEWAATLMLLMFLASWYLQTHCIFYRDIRRL
jgi:hypothetical protein